jgi:hypothetical protein
MGSLATACVTPASGLIREPSFGKQATMPAAQPEDDWSERIIRAMEGDEATYRRLLSDIGLFARQVVKRLVARWGLSEFAIEDIVQETVLAVHLKRHTWDRRRSLKPWVAEEVTNDPRFAQSTLARGARHLVSS